jgi:hypothetical protein
MGHSELRVEMEQTAHFQLASQKDRNTWGKVAATPEGETLSNLFGMCPAQKLFCESGDAT